MSFRRRRKKEKKKIQSGQGSSVTKEGDDVLSVCSGNEKQWLPTGLLSAESCADTCDSEASARSESDQETTSSTSSSASSKSLKHRKLAATLSVPTYSSYNSFRFVKKDQFCKYSSI